MITFEQARRAVRERFGPPHWKGPGTYMVAADGRENSSYWNILHGAREALVDGRPDFIEPGTPATLVDKRTGEITQMQVVGNFELFGSMTEVKARRKANRAAFGSTRKLPSGKWQARYPDEAGRPMTAPRTFTTKQAALDHIAEVQTDRNRGSYIDHRDGAETFGAYARAWIEAGGSRGKLAPRTSALYLDLLARQLTQFHAMPLSSISGKTVRDWYASTRRQLAVAARKRGGTGETRLRQAYALLRAVLGAAVADRLIADNPCRIVGAGVASSPERPHLSPEQLATITEAMPEHYRMPVRVMFGGHLRLGETVALQRGDFDPTSGVLRVERQIIELTGQTLTTVTKTGVARAVTLPPSVAAMVRDHPAGASGFPRSPMFTRPGGEPITRHSLQQAWSKAARSAGLAQFHLHDVRHAGLTLAAQAGATTRELMARGGHRTSAAALTYQHAAEQRAAVVADLMDGLLTEGDSSRYGTQLARMPLSPSE